MDDARARIVVVQFLCCACGAANSVPRRERQGVLHCEACGAEQPSAPIPDVTTGNDEATAPERRSALGRFSHLPGSSDDFVRAKQDEIDLEDRGWRPQPKT
jgi:hypothetical protein